MTTFSTNLILLGIFVFAIIMFVKGMNPELTNSLKWFLYLGVFCVILGVIIKTTGLFKGN